MPFHNDFHKRLDGVTTVTVAYEHMKELSTQKIYEVQYKDYWFDEGNGKIFCLVEEQSNEAAERVHHEAHGPVPDEIHEVEENSYRHLGGLGRAESSIVPIYGFLMNS